MNIENLSLFLDGGVNLVVTCDTGISSNEAVDYARSRGVDVIITDHHSLPDLLPDAFSVINPKRLPDDSPLTGLPGVGVAYKLAEALYQRAGRTAELNNFLDLVALGIVADLANQTGDTRYLLQRGLPILRTSQRTGLQILYELSGLQPAYLTEEHIGFVLGPRLNALGRLDDANPVVEFLTTNDPGRARVLATHLEGLNARRRLLTSQVLRAAQAQIEKDSSLLDQAALVLSHPEWPAGVIGIVASELAERYNRPTILLSAPPGQPARGSARSVEGVNITEAIADQKHLLLGYGGHPMAAGLSLNAEKIPAFRRGLSRSVEKALGGVIPRPTLAIDGALSIADLSLELIADLERLAPFGPGNPPLVFSIPDLTILNSSTIGRDGSHIQVVVKDANDRTQRVLWWGGADWPLPEGKFDLACTVRASNFRGQHSVQVEWVDARPVETAEIDLRRTLSVIDQRNLDHPLPVLLNMISEAGNSAVLWAEGDAREKLNAAGITVSDRTNLAPAETLILWSTPPGRAELQTALSIVNPKTVLIFGVDPAERSPEAFLKRLTGLIKYCIDKYQGKTSLVKLSAATSQRDPAVRLGLQWLAQRGMIQIQWLSEGQIHLAPGSPNEPVAAAETTASAKTIRELKALLEETAAYRKYFKSAEKGFLI